MDTAEPFLHDRADPARVRHDLLTPLNGVIGYAGILLEDAADLGRSELLPPLAEVRDAARGLADTVRGALDGRMDARAFATALAALRERCDGPARGVLASVQSLRAGLEADAEPLARDLDQLAACALAFAAEVADPSETLPRP